MSAPVRAFSRPLSAGRKPVTVCAMLASHGVPDASSVVTYSGRGDVGKVSGNTGGVDNIVERELVDQRRGLQEEREGLHFVSNGSMPVGAFSNRCAAADAYLTNATSGTCNNGFDHFDRCAKRVSRIEKLKYGVSEVKVRSLWRRGGGKVGERSEAHHKTPGGGRSSTDHGGVLSGDVTERSERCTKRVVKERYWSFLPSGHVAASYGRRVLTYDVSSPISLGALPARSFSRAVGRTRAACQLHQSTLADQQDGSKPKPRINL